MKPITRKELYLNKIVGNNDYETPEKPITTEEFFFAEILGEAVQAPEPLTRYQMYLAKIAGREIEIPYPEVRLEYFLAKAAGMEIETPTPITKEEIFWSNYSAIVDFEVEGIPPLTYKAVAGTLKDYRIYGNTVDGESVGDSVSYGDHAGEYRVPVTVEGKNLFNFDAWAGTLQQFYPHGNYNIVGEHEIALTATQDRSFTIPYRASDNGYRIFVLPNTAYTLSWISDSDNSGQNYVFENGSVESEMMHIVNNRSTKTMSFVTAATTSFVTLRFAVDKANTIIKYSSIQFERGLSATSYEPYRTPVITPIYLPEPLKMVGDEAEYIDYGEQKQHRVRKNLLQNTATSQEINGVIFTVNSDGSVTCNGTSTSQYYSLFRIPCYLVAGNYTISGCPVGGGSRKYRADIRISPNGEMVGVDADIGAGATIPIDESGWYDYTIRIQGGYTVDDVTFKPMIRKADIEDDTYEPYIENTDLDVNLPALPTLTGTNVMSVGTAVQPSKVYIKGEKEREYS